MLRDFPKEHDDEEGPMTVREMVTIQRQNVQEVCEKLHHQVSDEKKAIE